MLPILLQLRYILVLIFTLCIQLRANIDVSKCVQDNILAELYTGQRPAPDVAVYPGYRATDFE
ncbi:hypothetical protein EUX98_g4884 [Antrodiella citrinella]|uniref:Uncharacterized protein n=1 Tax=Antrodiella citrinella TaxID=2447956 RepID=A0A4S4MVC3_9APHY|nr:hypothetical protein EUX98_g4884 [Antrodiella citrinella]